mgnify:FL=1
MVDTGESWHELQSYFDFPHKCVVEKVIPDRDILGNRVSDILQRLFFGVTLRPAPW